MKSVKFRETGDLIELKVKKIGKILKIPMKLYFSSLLSHKVSIAYPQKTFLTYKFDHPDKPVLVFNLSTQNL